VSSRVRQGNRFRLTRGWRAASCARSGTTATARYERQRYDAGSRLFMKICCRSTGRLRGKAPAPSRQVHSKAFEMVERTVSQSSLMGRAQDDPVRLICLECFLPAGGARGTAWRRSPRARRGRLRPSIWCIASRNGAFGLMASNRGPTSRSNCRAVKLSLSNKRLATLSINALCRRISICVIARSRNSRADGSTRY
jgi:hypothetical protein